MENEVDLLKAARAMDAEALVRIFDLYASALFHYALRLGCDTVSADHIVGDVFAKLLEHLSQGQGPRSNLRAYLFQMTYHCIIDGGRSAGRNAPLEVAESVPTDGHSAPSSLEERAMLDIVLKVIENDLTDDQRHVIVLRFWEEFSLKETAAILGKEVSHIKVIQNRAIAKLRKRLDHPGLESAIEME